MVSQVRVCLLSGQSNEDRTVQTQDMTRKILHSYGLDETRLAASSCVIVFADSDDIAPLSGSC